MSTPTEQDYSAGNKLIAGIVFTEQENLAADVYYNGMPLSYDGTTTAAAPVGTGNGVATVLSAAAGVPAGAYTLTATAALVFDLADPDGNILATGLTVPNGSAAAFDVAGLRFTLTDGTTPWVAADVITITVSAAGVYSYYDGGTIDAFYNGATKTLASAGYGSVIVGGELYEGGMVTGANVVITMTVALRAQMRANGFYPRKVA